MKNNIFNYGTTELTHDAILSWILGWGNYKENDLYYLSKELFKLLIGQEIEPDKVEIKKQYKNIDILVILNETIVVVIEDKLFSLEHSNQLYRYKNIIDEEYHENKRYYNYITIGNESDYIRAKNNGYNVIKREDLLKLIRNYVGKNHILDDYYDYLKMIDYEYNLHNTQEIDKWSNMTWEGFYTQIQMYKKDSYWNYVSNPRGGFIAFVWNNKKFLYKDCEYNLYLQIDSNPKRIVFKVEVFNIDYAKEIRDYIKEKLINSPSVVG